MSNPSPVAEALASLQRRFALLADLTQAASLLAWDRHTYLPAASGVGRGRQSAALEAICHEKLSDPMVGEWLARLEDVELVGADARTVQLCRRRHDRAVRLPATLVQDLADARSLAQDAWHEARRHNDHARFAPALARMFELSREQAEQLGYQEHPYDALHDDYEAGSTASRVRELFSALRPALVELAGSLTDSPAGDSENGATSPLHGDFDPRLQEEFVVAEVERFGYDFTRGRLDPTVHPFAQAMGRNDVRITTRYRSDYLAMGVFATFHEAGHGIYEQGLPAEFERNPIGESVSLGVHESQSRLWENLVGRSLAYWRGAYPRLQAVFPSALGSVDVETFYRAVNRVRPSLVRIEADEVTYNLHVIARFELESALLAGELAAADLPGAWNAKYQELMGITPPDHLLGCLQDVHWSLGLIGYFPTYTLGNLMSVQLFEAARNTIPDLDATIEAGDFRPLLGWLRQHIHRQGSLYRPDELLERATGSVLDAAPYLRYLNSKFKGIASRPEASVPEQ